MNSPANEKSISLLQEDSEYIAKCARIPYYPFVIKKGYGAIVEDIDGKVYIDFLSSAAVTNTGHSHPKVVEAIRNQACDFIHYTSAYFYHESLVLLAKKLLAITPGNHKKRVMFGLSGSDANDGMIKAARAYTGRSKIISFEQSYHGTTFGALSLTALSLNMRRKFGPFLPDIFHFEYPECYRCKYGRCAGDCDLECLGSIKRAFANYLPPEEVAAIIIEPLAGDAGLILPPQKYMQQLYALCRENGILFAVDEVQQGFGRTGKWFSIEHFDIVPDMISMAKGIASGMPLSAVVGRDEILQSLEMPAHLFSTSANPVCCQAALATINVIEEENLVEQSARLGEHVKLRFQSMKEKYEIIGDIRGSGLSIGVDLITSRYNNTKNHEAAAKICYRSWQKGLILIFVAKNVLRIQPPLVITLEQLDLGLEIIEDSIREFTSGILPDDILGTAIGW